MLDYLLLLSNIISTVVIKAIMFSTLVNNVRAISEMLIVPASFQKVSLGF